MQSPDEGVHLLRAHLLTKGVLVLDTISGHRSGGYVDENLWDYQLRASGALAADYDKKVTRDNKNDLSAIEWSGKTLFAPIPTTGYYFPLIYAPQAVGLLVGELAGLTVQQSYYLARLCAFLGSMLLIGIAVHLFPPSPVVIGLVLMPISIFQFVSASMDGVAVALAVLCISLYMRGSIKLTAFPDWMSYVLAAGLFILVTSRIQVLAFILMPFVLALQHRRALYLLQGLGLAVLSAGWLYLAISQTVDGGIHHPGHSHFDVARHYLTNISELSSVLTATLDSRANQLAYLYGFIGILGWLDASFSTTFYKVMAIAFGLVIVLSVSLSNFKETWQARLGLIIMFLASVFTVLFALLVQWNPFPATSIEGIQGRYFIVPCCALGYALSGATGFKSIPARLAIIGLLVMLAMVSMSMPQLLLDRYFIGTGPAP